MKKLVAVVLTAAALGVGSVGVANAANPYAGGKPSKVTTAPPKVKGDTAKATIKVADGAKGTVTFTFVSANGFTKKVTKPYKAGVSAKAVDLPPGHYKVTVKFDGTKGWADSKSVRWFWVK